MKLKIILPFDNILDINYNLEIEYYLHDDEIRLLNAMAGETIMRIDVNDTLERMRNRLTVTLYKAMDKLIDEITPIIYKELERINQKYYEGENENEEKTP